MKVLVAEDEPSTRTLLRSSLEKWGHEPVMTADGEGAWQALQQPGAPRLAILDWVMPGLDGVEVCRRLRAHPPTASCYVLLLTGRAEREDAVEALDAGADDYVVKPFHRAELRARVRAGERIVELQDALNTQITQLQAALDRVDRLEGILPICSYCKKIRDDQNYWQQVESYVAEHSSAKFSHGICPECWTNVVQPQLAEMGLPPEPEPGCSCA